MTPGPNILASIDLNTGALSPVTTQGVPLQPKGLVFVPTGGGDRPDNSGTNDLSGDSEGGSNG